jgi:hypothetical protein
VSEIDDLWVLARQVILKQIIGITPQVGGSELAAVVLNLSEAYAWLTDASKAH